MSIHLPQEKINAIFKNEGLVIDKNIILKYLPKIFYDERSNKDSIKQPGICFSVADSQPNIVENELLLLET